MTPIFVYFHFRFLSHSHLFCFALSIGGGGGGGGGGGDGVVTGGGGTTHRSQWNGNGWTPRDDKQPTSAQTNSRYTNRQQQIFRHFPTQCAQWWWSPSYRHHLTNTTSNSNSNSKGVGLWGSVCIKENFGRRDAPGGVPSSLVGHKFPPPV